MSLDCLKIDSACTVIRLSQSTMDCEPLVGQVEPYLAQNCNLVLDAHGISFSSMEIGELVNLADDFLKAWEGRACGMAIVNLSPSAQSIFVASKLDKIFPSFDTVSDALDHFSTGEMAQLKASQ